MLWVAPTEKDTATTTLEKRLWDAADQFRANTRLNLDRIFLRFAVRLRCRHPQGHRFLAETRGDELFSEGSCP
jgi:type I restriction enzyme M protein